MVYCRLISANNGIARYYIGADTNDITGIIEIDTNNKMYSIEKEPDRIPLYMRHVDSMVHRAGKKLLNGEFPDKLSYEI